MSDQLKEALEACIDALTCVSDNIPGWKVASNALDHAKAALAASDEWHEPDERILTGWIEISEREPELSDRSILMHFGNGSIETVHVEDFFKPITAGVVEGVQQYTKWWANHDPPCTHWMELPSPPSNDYVPKKKEK